MQGRRRWSIASVAAVATMLSGAPAQAAAPSLARDWDYLDNLIGRPYDVETPMRSTGRNIWMTRPVGWGFPSDVHYVHLDWMAPFAVDIRWRGLTVTEGNAWAHASHVATEGIAPTADITFEERKFVTDDDVLVAVYRLTNQGAIGVLEIDVTSAMVGPAADGMRGTTVRHGIPLALYLQMDGAALDGSTLGRSTSVASGQTVEIRVAMAFARDPQTATDGVNAVFAAADPVAAERREHGQWFLDNVPQIDVPDPWIEKAYAFRWEVVRRNTMDPRWGLIQHPAFTEGRWIATWFPRVITYGSPHQLREARWLRDPAFARGHALTLVDNQRSDGAFVGARVDEPATEYTDWIANAIWHVFLVTGDTDLIERSLQAMRCNVDYVLTRDGDGDHLPVVADHFQTGMEWQPAFFYFSNYDTSSSTPLERVDYAASLYGNAAAAAAAAQVVCAPSTAAEMSTVASAVQAAVVSKMWDPATEFYYSLRETDDALAMAREIVGFYPFAYGLSPASHDVALAKLVDSDEFWWTWPVASSSRSCPATSQSGWPLGPGGSPAMWNGPIWPHALNVVADAAAATIRRSGESFVTRAQLFEMFSTYTLANFKCLGQVQCAPSMPRNIMEPIVGEFYHGDYGFWRTGERDYFHSTYADWLITNVIGLQPMRDSVVRIDPLLPTSEWDRFMLDRVRYRGHDVTVVWDEVGGVDHYGDGREGLDLYLDGDLVGSRPALGLLEARLPAPVLLAVDDGSGGVSFTRTPSASAWTLYRATVSTLTDADPLATGPYTGDVATDPSPPVGDAFYRAGGCGSGL